MGDTSNEVQQIEQAIHAYENKSRTQADTRREIRTLLQNLAGIPGDKSISLAGTLETIATDGEASRIPQVGATVLRILACAGLFPPTTLGKANRHIVRIVEQGCPYAIKHLKIDNRSQSYEKVGIFARMHGEACEQLDSLRPTFTNLHDLVGRKQTVMKALNFGPTRNYLRNFGFQPISSSVTGLLNLSDKVVNSDGRMLQLNLHNLMHTVVDEIEHYKTDQTFVVRNHYLPFLEYLKNKTFQYQTKMVASFECDIIVPQSPHELEKRYPLHASGTEFQIFVPLRNTGPGVAEDVRAYCVSDHCKIKSDETNLGNIEPGGFVLTLEICVEEPLTRLELEVGVDYDIVGESEKQEREFSVVIHSQRTDIDWEELSKLQPYRLEVAYDHAFFGRQDAVGRILRYLNSESMQSCYITGQKRVGKSSLARAIEASIGRGLLKEEYSVHYLECGEVRHSSAEYTMREFGQQVEDFLVTFLPRSAEWKLQDYSTSLNPLNRLLNLLLAETPTRRFVVIFDEFDEINEDLYRHGELANTFFLNLRTLSSKRNLAFILVGAERMPYVMSAQGEKLNKFARESLDNFELATEWADYRALIETPVRDAIKLHEPALRKLYDLTNGHPYFTKVLCANVFENAVQAKDAEVSTSEVSKAAERVVASLDVNAFAHYWRDGIRGDAEDVEIVSLHRCRVLVAWARAARAKGSATHEGILSNLHSSRLSSNEVHPLLDDFCRRGVFRTMKETFVPTVELFGNWLVEGGFTRLISDQLGDELAELQQEREDAAYVHSKEIVELVEKWDLYQGRQIASEEIRAWIEQVESHVLQRILFKVLEHVRFVREPEIREMFAHAHSRIRSKLPVHVMRKRSDRRNDILVTYVDGAGKSGAYFAGIYANENRIISRNVVEPGMIEGAINDLSEEEEYGVVVVDDMIGTGDGLVENLKKLNARFSDVGIGTNIPLALVIICGTRKGEVKVTRFLEENIPNADLEICELLDNRHFAFSDDKGFWESDEEKNAAKSLIRDLGSRVHRRNPLGYAQQGLLLTFPRNCPNNSLPILHSFGRGEFGWNPIFRRSKIGL